MLENLFLVSLKNSFQTQLLNLRFNQGNVFWLINTVSAVVDHNDLDLVAVLNNLELLKVLHKLHCSSQYFVVSETIGWREVK